MPEPTPAPERFDPSLGGPVPVPSLEVTSSPRAVSFDRFFEEDPRLMAFEQEQDGELPPLDVPPLVRRNLEADLGRARAAAVAAARRAAGLGEAPA